MFDDKTLLVTGGTGSFGQKFISTIFEHYKPKKVIVYSRDEQKQFLMQTDPQYAHSNLRYFLGDVRDINRLSFALRGEVDFVVHAAALKQVPALEYNPFEAVKTNVLGAQNVIESCIANNVRRVIALSTDKAAAPINLYGATKLTSDKLFIAANNYAGNTSLFSVIRYGNVLGSRGSVVPYFLEKRKVGPLPITDMRMTRFSITLKEGVEFVISCFSKMLGGELFVPKIPSYRIIDLAEAIAPEAEHRLVGVRPGEKIHEEMITVSDASNTMELEDYYMILPNPQFVAWVPDNKITGPQEGRSKPCQEGFSYNSGTNDHFLSVEELRGLIYGETETP